MKQAELRRYLEQLSSSLSREDKLLLEARLEGLISIFPFSEYEYIISFLIDRNVLSFVEYEKLRDRYVSSNQYLELYNLSPRVFGQIWGEKHLKDLDSRFHLPNKSLDPEYDGEYDLWIEGVKVEVKAARAVNKKKGGSLISKALYWDSQESFWMNFQQLKPAICDVFIFIGVWVDKIVYWVMSSKEVEKSPYLSHQHRGGVEYQISVTKENLAMFESYRVNPKEIGDAVVKRGRLS